MIGPSPARDRAVFWILIAALTFNAALCFINTTAFRVSDAAVIGCELVLVSAAFGLALGREAAPYIVLGVFLSYMAAIMAMRPLFDPKSVRDFLIPVAFYLLGRRQGALALADRAAVWSGVIVVALGLFEFAELDTYVKYFDIIKYYVARGTVAPSDVPTGGSALFASGMRPDARAILPFLGPHRASSVFLEPVSTGDFGAILYLWALCRSGMRGRWLAFSCGLGAIVLADARFGLNTCIVGTAVWFAAPRLPRALFLALPFAILSALAIYGFTTAQIDWSNDFSGRLLWTAQLITSLGDRAVWGLSPDKPFLDDSGYAYTLNQIGLLGFAGFWMLFILAPERRREAWRFKACVATYICLLMLISDSLYSIKTAALLWFMLGSSDAAPNLRSETAPSRLAAAGGLRAPRLAVERRSAVRSGRTT